MRLLHISLKPLFAICLLGSQFVASRTTILTDNIPMVIVGAVIITLGILLFISASITLNKALKTNEVAITGTYRYIRHPIYLVIYIFSIGLGLLFYTWVWFLVLAVFLPLWYMVAKDEEKQMIELHGSEYAEYRTETGMFLPKIGLR
jgi:protein-S-isoprenylcysteine O-methyltransferase Ste14